MTIDNHGNIHASNGEFAGRITTPAGITLTPTIQDGPFHFVAVFPNDEFGTLRIKQDDTDPEDYTVYGFDGAVTFRANEDATPDELHEEALAFYADDELEERGAGLDSLFWQDKLELVNSYLNVALDLSSDEEGEKYDADTDDFAPEAVKQIEEELDGFLRGNMGLVTLALETMTWSDLAVTVYMTRSGISSFTERGIGRVGTDLDDMIRPMGDNTVFLDSDGKLRLQ